MTQSVIDEKATEACRHFFRLTPPRSFLGFYSMRVLHEVFHLAFHLGAVWGINKTKQVYADDFGIHREKYGTKND